MDKQAKKFNEHWRWWKTDCAGFLRDESISKEDVALAAAASAWNAGVDWGKEHERGLREALVAECQAGVNLRNKYEYKLEKELSLRGDPIQPPEEDSP